MDKILVFPTVTEKGVHAFNIEQTLAQEYLHKIAAEYHPQVASYISQAKPIPGVSQVLLTALGAYEAYGDNNNGDAFPEAALAHFGKDYGHKTFEYYAKVYKHHISKDPNNNYGNVALSVWNDQMKRVELIVKLLNERLPEETAKIDRGESLDVSMGCAVPWDQCNICGHRAAKRADYCVHALFSLGRIDPDTGKKVFVFNRYPRFKDISIVGRRADFIAKAWLKVASDSKSQPYTVIGSAELAEKVAEQEKKSEITKKVESNISPALTQKLDNVKAVSGELVHNEPEMPISLLKEMSQFPIASVLSTLAHSGIVPKPQELQYIVISRSGTPHLADELHAKQQLAFSPLATPDISKIPEDTLSTSHFNPLLMSLLSSLMAERSYSAPLLRIRLLNHIEKKAEIVGEHKKRLSWDVSPTVAIPALAVLYHFMRNKGPMAAQGGAGRLSQMYPIFGAALALAAVAGITGALKPTATGNYDTAPAPTTATDWQTRLNKLNQQPIAKVGASDIAIRAFGLAPMAYLASGYEQYKKMQDPSYTERQSIIGRIIEKHPGKLALLPAAEYLVGKPISGPAMEKVKRHFGTPLKKFLMKKGGQDNIEDIDDELFKLTHLLRRKL